MPNRRQDATYAAIRTRISRRHFMRSLGAGALVLMAGCSAYPAEEGSAFEAWSFPNGETRPERIAVAAAVLAANPHNTQPWRFRVSAERIDVFADLTRSLGAMDPLGREMHIGLGCAIENLVIAAQANGRATSVVLMPTPSDPTHVAQIDLTPDTSAATDDVRTYYAAIPRRHTNRGAYLQAPAPAGLAQALRDHAQEDTLTMHFLEGEADKARFRQGSIDATQAIVDDHEMNETSHAWYRHSHDDILRHRDGLTIDATGLGNTTRFLGKSVAPPSADEAGEFWVNATRSRQTTGSAFVILSTQTRDDQRQQLTCGRAYQRMHLWATTVGLAMQPLNQMAERQDREQQQGLEPTFTRILADLTGEPGDSRAQVLFRIGYAWDDALKSPRRALADVLTEG